jgi:hypothetical protein
MSEPVPVYAQKAYAVLRTKFGNESFGTEPLSWFISQNMVKKTLHELEHAGWINRVDKGRYICLDANEVFRSMVEFRVPTLLKASGMKYSYTGTSAVEIWTDSSYIQRSWEHSPYYIKVLRTEVDQWVEYFRKHKIRVFVSNAEYALGEFVVLKPQETLPDSSHAGSPVDPLNEVTAFCEANVDSFEYPLAYLKSKFGVITKVEIDQRVMDEAARAIV